MGGYRNNCPPGGPSVTLPCASGAFPNFMRVTFSGLVDDLCPECDTLNTSIDIPYDSSGSGFVAYVLQYADESGFICDEPGFIRVRFECDGSNLSMVVTLASSVGANWSAAWEFTISGADAENINETKSPPDTILSGTSACDASSSSCTVVSL